MKKALYAIAAALASGIAFFHVGVYLPGFENLAAIVTMGIFILVKPSFEEAPSDEDTQEE